MPEVELAQVGTALAASLLYSLIFYAKKRANTGKETFNPKKLIATLAVGAIVGVNASLAGADLTYLTIEEKLAMYGGTIAIVESGVKIVYRTAKRRLTK